MTQPGKQLKKVSAMFARRMQSILRETKSEYVSGVFSWVIAFLSENTDKPIYQRDIENEFGLSRSAVSRALGQMEQKGLIIRTSCAEDCRLKQLRLTEKAKAASQQLMAIGPLVENELMKGFSPDEKAALCNYLTRMEQNLRETLSNENYCGKE